MVLDKRIGNKEKTEARNIVNSEQLIVNSEEKKLQKKQQKQRLKVGEEI